jgi:hypothetical protein
MYQIPLEKISPEGVGLVPMAMSESEKMRTRVATANIGPDLAIHNGVLVFQYDTIVRHAGIPFKHAEDILKVAAENTRIWTDAVAGRRTHIDGVRVKDYTTYYDLNHGNNYWLVVNRSRVAQSAMQTKITSSDPIVRLDSEGSMLMHMELEDIANLHNGGVLQPGFVDAAHAQWVGNLLRMGKQSFRNGDGFAAFAEANPHLDYRLDEQTREIVIKTGNPLIISRPRGSDFKHIEGLRSHHDRSGLNTSIGLYDLSLFRLEDIAMQENIFLITDAMVAIDEGYLGMVSLYHEQQGLENMDVYHALAPVLKQTFGPFNSRFEFVIRGTYDEKLELLRRAVRGELEARLKMLWRE